MNGPGGATFVAESSACEHHFPGAPLMPGALLLDEILRRLPGGAHAPLAVLAVKFRRPVRPGTEVRLEHAIDATGRLRFALHAAGQVVVDGVIGADPAQER